MNKIHLPLFWQKYSRTVITVISNSDSGYLQYREFKGEADMASHVQFAEILHETNSHLARQV
jgi:hypothetical protein